MIDVVSAFHHYAATSSEIVGKRTIEISCPVQILNDHLLTMNVGNESIDGSGNHGAEITTSMPHDGGATGRLSIQFDPWRIGAMLATHGPGATITVMSSVSPFPLATIPLTTFTSDGTDAEYAARLEQRIDPTHWGIDALFISDGRCFVLGWALPPVDKTSQLAVSIDGENANVTSHLHSGWAGRTYWFIAGAPRFGFLAVAPWKGTEAFARIEVHYPSDADSANNVRRFAIYNYVLELESLRPPLPPVTNIQRVSGPVGSQISYLNSGYTDFQRFCRIMKASGKDPFTPGLRLLDWGCGCGRIARHFVTLPSQPHVTGIDIDEANVGWCRANLPAGNFVTVGLVPPTPLPDNSVDVVISSSVLSHLTRPAMTAWLSEIHRVLAPGGLALLSYNGDTTSYVYASAEPRIVDQLLGEGFYDGIRSSDLDSFISDREYYRLTFMSDDYARSVFSRELEVKQIVLSAVSGHQNIAVLQKHESSETTHAETPDFADISTLTELVHKTWAFR
jgi:SAM-dependent methyltransferase